MNLLDMVPEGDGNHRDITRRNSLELERRMEVVLGVMRVMRNARVLLRRHLRDYLGVGLLLRLLFGRRGRRRCPVRRRAP